MISRYQIDRAALENERTSGYKPQTWQNLADFVDDEIGRELERNPALWNRAARMSDTAWLAACGEVTAWRERQVAMVDNFFRLFHGKPRAQNGWVKRKNNGTKAVESEDRV